MSDETVAGCSLVTSCVGGCNVLLESAAAARYSGVKEMAFLLITAARLMMPTPSTG
jgi:hypothetical protein